MKNKEKINNINPIVRAAASLIPALFLFYVAYDTSNSIFGKYFSISERQKVSATMSVLELKKSHDGPDKYYLEAQYSYFFQGTEYQDDSVQLSKAPDSKEYWQDLYLKLQQDNANKRLVAWVNPNNPKDAILDKKVRLRLGELVPVLAFLLLFVGAGLVILWIGIRPQKPEHEGIEPEDRNPLIWVFFLFGITFFLCGAIASVYLVPTHLAEGKSTAIIPIVFLVIGVGLIAMVINIRRSLKTIGSSLLYLDPLPGVIGGQVGGEFKLTASQVSPITITLSCQSRGESDEILWQQSMPAYVQQRRKGISVRFVFDCPADLPSSGAKFNSIAWIVWAKGEVELEGKIRKFKRSWIVPVEHGEVIDSLESTVDIPRQFLDEQIEQREKTIQTQAKSSLVFKRQARLLDLQVADRQAGISALVGLFIGSVIGAVGAIVISQGKWFGYIIFAFAALVLSGSVFAMGKSLDIKIDTDNKLLYMRRKWFGLVLYKREVTLDRASQFSLKMLSTSSVRDEYTQYYAIEVWAAGKSTIIAEGIKGKELAQAVMDDLIKKVFSDTV